MKAHREEFPVELMARVLKVSRAGYYAFLKRTIAPRAQEQVKFDSTVQAVFEQRKKRYGSIRITRELNDRGCSCNRKRVSRSLRRQGLRAKYSKKFIATTDSKHSYPVAGNILNRDFSAERPNQKWVSDITYLPCLQGWLYLVVFIDLYSRRVVGWYVSHSLQHESVLTAFYRAVSLRGGVRGLIVHSDRGIQYCCSGFTKVMKQFKVIQSMSRKGNCWDNAVAESFFATLKRELVGNYVFQNLSEAERMLFEYIERDYNRQQLHSANGYMAPVAFEKLRWQKCA